MVNTDLWQKVILIDDDSLLNLIHRKFLEIVGYHGTILEFHNGFQALEFIYREIETAPTIGKVIYLIILDLEMPTLNVWGFLERFQKLDPKVKGMFKIIVSSSSLNPEDINRALAYESVGEYISKPLTIEAFRRIIGDGIGVVGEK
ncbi:response regulator [Aquiflexum sp.]|uniref:response regulator n=1 Tax=Aquiflexum sp. TaxID=1872584 RepID=UPI003592ECF8